MSQEHHRAHCDIADWWAFERSDSPRSRPRPDCTCGRDALLKRLRELVESSNGPNSLDPDKDHEEADKALLRFIGDKEITKAFLSIKRWYS